MNRTLLFFVEDSFSVQGRGLAIYGDVFDLEQWPNNIGVEIELQHPNGRVISTRIAGVELSKDDQKVRCILLPPGIDPSDVPPGTRVSRIDPNAKSDEEIIRLFDLEKARERLLREGHLGRPFRETIDKRNAKYGTEK